MDNFFKNPKRKTKENSEENHKEYTPEYKKYGITPVDYSSQKPVVIPSSSKKENKKNQNQVYSVESDNSLPTLFTKKDLKFPETSMQVDPYDTPTEFFTVENNLPLNASENFEDQSEPETNNEIKTNASFDDECILIINDNIVDIGKFSKIQSQVEDLIFGNHPKFEGQIPSHEIKVYKKMKIKIGVFVE